MCFLGIILSKPVQVGFFLNRLGRTIGGFKLKYRMFYSFSRKDFLEVKHHPHFGQQDHSRWTPRDHSAKHKSHGSHIKLEARIVALLLYPKMQLLLPPYRFVGTFILMKLEKCLSWYNSLFRIMQKISQWNIKMFSMVVHTKLLFGWYWASFFTLQRWYSKKAHLGLKTLAYAIK